MSEVMTTEEVPEFPKGPDLPDARIFKKRGARLLSLDGGGVKGISSVVILQEIMKRVREIENESGADTSQKPRKPVDYFDLAGGTSTGGLIALMLFRLKMDTESCRLAYEGLARHIFARTFCGLPLPRWLWSPISFLKAAYTGYKFDSGPLEAAINEVVRENPLSPHDPQQQLLINPGSGYMFMCATVKDKGEAILLRSYTWPEDAAPITSEFRQVRNDPDGTTRINPQKDGNKLVLNDIPIVNAARATSAAPTYLPEEQWPEEKKRPFSLRRLFSKPKEGWRGMTFWDGGVLNNNPIEQVWNARYDLVDYRSPPPPVSCVLSLGCGHSDTKVERPSKVWRIFSIGARFLESYMANTAAKTLDFQRLVQRMIKRGDENREIKYFRFNVDCKSEAFDLADFDRMGRLVELTMIYIEENHAEIEDCARSLAKKPPSEDIEVFPEWHPYVPARSG